LIFKRIDSYIDEREKYMKEYVIELKIEWLYQLEI